MTHRILLADDSVTIRKVVELTFSDEDFAIVSVGDGAQALERARSERPDIIISDVIMPGLNGYELCQRVKADPALRAVPFLFLKGTFEGFDEEKARACGADGFIVKPFESQEMIARVKQMIAGAASPPPTQAAAPVQPAAAPAFAPAPAAQAPPAAMPLPLQPPAPPRPAPPVQSTSPTPAATPGPLPVPRPVAIPQARPTLLSPTPAAAAPPPLPRPTPVQPPVQPMPPRPSPPPVPPPPARVAPPIPPRPTRPVDLAPPPPPPQARPVPLAPEPPPPPPPPTAQSSIADFGFDLGESEGESFGSFGLQPAAQRPAAASQEPSGEADEDLWSEVSLRDQTSDILETRPPSGSGAWPGSGLREPEEDAGTAAADVVFEEVSTGRITPTQPAPEDYPPAFPTPPAPEPRLETPFPTAPVPAAAPPEPAPAPAAAAAIDPAEIERMVAAHTEAAVKKVLEPLVTELARTLLEAVAWEVIPDLAEAMIRAEIERIRKSTRTD